MLIKEIEISHTGGVNLGKITRDGEHPFGFNHEIDGFDFFKNTNDEYQVYYLVDNDKIIAALAGVIIVINGVEYFQTKGVYVDPAHRGRELALKMYHAIRFNEPYRLMSDTKQTRDGIKIWSKIFKKFPTKVMNLETGKIVSDKIHDAYTSAKYVLVTEEVAQAGIIIPPLLE